MAKKRRKGLFILLTVVIIIAVGTFVYSRMDSPPPDIDSSLLAVVERGNIAPWTAASPRTACSPRKG